MLHRLKEMVYCIIIIIIEILCNVVIYAYFLFLMYLKFGLRQLNKGWRCITGSKMYCCPTNDRRPNDKFMIPAILFGVRDHVKLIPIADLPTRKPIPS